MAYSGLRPEVLGNIDGSDGLTIGDIPDIRIEKNVVEFEKMPIRIVVRHELSKIRQQYFTFLGPGGSKYLKEYLEMRINTGEKLNKVSPVILPIEKQSLEKKNKFLLTTLLLRRIKATIIKSGFSWRPYIFRIYFGTNLDSAEAKGVISHPWRQFIMGHKGDIEETYTKREGKIDEGREQYEKCLQFIEAEKKGIAEKDQIRHYRESTLNAVEIYADLKLSGDEKEKLLSLSTDEFNEELRRLVKRSKAQELNNGNRHKTIPEMELETYLNKGWELIQIYPKGDKAVIKMPD